MLVCLYAAFLLAVLVIDLEHRLVLNVMLAPAALLALVASLLPGGLSPEQAVLGGIVAFAGFFVLAFVGRGALGYGDVKLAGVIGLMVGYPAVIGALFAGVLLGGARRHRTHRGSQGHTQNGDRLRALPGGRCARCRSSLRGPI